MNEQRNPDAILPSRISGPDSRLTNLSVVLPHLRPGGIETATVGWLNALHGTAVNARLILGRREGALLNRLRPEIAVTDLGGARAMGSVRRLARLLATGCDVVYSGTNARNLATLAAVRLIGPARRPKVIVSEHTTPDAYLTAAKARPLRMRAMRALYPHADALAVPAAGLGDAWLNALRIDRPAPIVLPNPILTDADIALAKKVRRGQAPARDPARILAAGRLHPAKGFDLLVEAFARANARRPDLRLEIYGEGGERARLQSRIEALAPGGRIRLCGHATDLPQRIAAAGLFVVPSRREGFGNVVVEALAMGTPVLASDCPGPSGLLAQAPGAGRIVPVGDVAALATAIIEMVGDDTFREAANRHGLSLADRYSIRAASATFADLLNQLVAARQGGDGRG